MDFLPKHPWSMKTTFKRCYLMNFSMLPDILQQALPPPIEPNIYKGKAFLSVVVSDLEKNAPIFFFQKSSAYHTIKLFIELLLH